MKANQFLWVSLAVLTLSAGAIGFGGDPLAPRTDLPILPNVPPPLPAPNPCEAFRKRTIEQFDAPFRMVRPTGLAMGRTCAEAKRDAETSLVAKLQTKKNECAGTFVVDENYPQQTTCSGGVMDADFIADAAACAVCVGDWKPQAPASVETYQLQAEVAATNGVGVGNFCDTLASGESHLFSTVSTERGIGSSTTSCAQATLLAIESLAAEYNVAKSACEKNIEDAHYETVPGTYDSRNDSLLVDPNAGCEKRGNIFYRQVVRCGFCRRNS